MTRVKLNFLGFVLWLRALGEVAGPSSIICSQTKKSPEERQPQKLSTRDKAGDLVSGHSSGWTIGPLDRTGPMLIIELPSSQAAPLPYHFLAGKESVRQCRAVRGRCCDN